MIHITQSSPFTVRAVPRLVLLLIMIVFIGSELLAQVPKKVQDALEEELNNEIRGKDVKEKTTPKEPERAKETPKPKPAPEPAETPSPQKAAPSAVLSQRFETIRVDIKSIEAVADRLFIKMVITATERDMRFYFRGARLINSNGEEFNASTGHWNDLSLVSDIPLKHEITFTGPAVTRSTKIGVLEIKVHGEAAGVLQFKHIDLPFGK